MVPIRKSEVRIQVPKSSVAGLTGPDGRERPGEESRVSGRQSKKTVGKKTAGGEEDGVKRAGVGCFTRTVDEVKRDKASR